MITENLSTLKIHKLTKEQYQRELVAGRIDENALYLTPDEEVDLTPYATVEQLNTKADAEHTHSIGDVTNLQSSLDEIDLKFATKSDTTHNHDGTYDAKGSASTALNEAKEYTNTAVSNLASTTVVDNKISTHNTSTAAHNDIRVLINDLTTKLNNFLDVDDATTDQLSEVLTLIENNKGTLESLTTSKVNVSDIIDNLTTASASKVLSANQGVVIRSLITDLETALEGKVATSALSDYYTKTEIDDMEFITVNDIDIICGATIQVATLSNEVVF